MHLFDINLRCHNKLLESEEKQQLPIREKLSLMSSSEEFGIYQERVTLRYPCVIYRDYKGFWSPLSALFWSTSSQLLVSWHPFSCVEDIISQYCPQCLSRYMEEEVKTSLNRCPSCFQCPCCSGTLHRSSDSAGVTNFTCSGCSWRHTLRNDSGSPSMADHFNKILQSLRDEESGGIQTQTPIPPANLGTRWRMSDLEKSLASKCAPHNTHKKESCEAESSESSLATSDCILTTLNQRLNFPGIQPSMITGLKPVGVALRSKKTVRCRKDVEEGKMSILVQPKLFPLEGDSSQKLQRGKWFVKDSSAVHEVPSISITKLPDSKSIEDKESSLLHITITNPKDSKLRIWISHDSTCSSDNILQSDDKTGSVIKCGVRPFICSTEELVLESTDALEFEVGAFEDELLRDDDDDVDLDVGSVNSMKSIEDSSMELATRGWTYSSSHNIANIVIAVRLSHTDSQESIGHPLPNQENKSTCMVYALPLLIHTELQDDSQPGVASPRLRYQAMIAFPAEKR